MCEERTMCVQCRTCRQNAKLGQYPIEQAFVQTRRSERAGVETRLKGARVEDTTNTIYEW